MWKMGGVHERMQENQRVRGNGRSGVLSRVTHDCNLTLTFCSTCKWNYLVTTLKQLFTFIWWAWPNNSLFFTISLLEKKKKKTPFKVRGNCVKTSPSHFIGTLIYKQVSEAHSHAAIRCWSTLCHPQHLMEWRKFELMRTFWIMICHD